MTYEEWADQYGPVPNHIQGEDVPFGHMFETYGPEEAHINRVSREHVWTIVETDGEWWLTPDRHYVNRIGYFISLEPWDQNNIPEDICLEDD